MARRLHLTPRDFRAYADDPANLRDLLLEEQLMEIEDAVEAVRTARAGR
jgi:hypothetical protein